MNIPHDLIIVVPLLLVGYGHHRISKSGTFLLVLSNVPITIMHEMAHFIVALFLGAEPTSFSLWPKKDGNKWILGSVTARVTFLSAVPTALAPLLWLPVGGVLLVERIALSGDSLEKLCGVYLVAYLCLAACIPSWQDIKVALSHPLSLVLWAAIFAAAMYVLQLQLATVWP
jgi:hypothetical protein